jgi:hypothetical protein
MAILLVERLDFWCAFLHAFFLYTLSDHVTWRPSFFAYAAAVPGTNSSRIDAMSVFALIFNAAKCSGQ